jgi:cytochrome c-type biogenesis protein CcmH/NrfF
MCNIIDKYYRFINYRPGVTTICIWIFIAFSIYFFAIVAWCLSSAEVKTNPVQQLQLENVQLKQ